MFPTSDSGSVYDGLLDGDSDQWAFGTDFDDPLAGLEAAVPDGLRASALAAYCLMLGDDALVASHRLSEWSGRAPDLEVDIALANIALDLLGQARMLLIRAAAVDPSVVPPQPAGSPAPPDDALAFFREDRDFRNVRLVEADNGDFGETVSRLLVFATWRLALLGRLTASRDAVLRAKTIAHGRDLVLGMARCRVPVVAAVNGPAVGLGCSLVALSDIVYMADTAYLADPHVQIGLVAADGGPLTWPLHTSLLLAKEYALTGARIPAARAVAIGLANHVVADPLTEAVACAKRIATLPRQAVESTKRVLNLQLERAVLATLDFAMAAEEQSFATDDFRAILAKLTEGKTS